MLEYMKLKQENVSMKRNLDAIRSLILNGQENQDIMSSQLVEKSTTWYGDH